MREAWAGGRAPLIDKSAEEARKEAYWAWLDDSDPTDDEKGAFAGYAVNAPRFWRRIDGPAAADHEARHMRHSIGHSWDVYGAMGDVYSLRDGDETPHATVLVVDGEVVHAREEHNSRLSRYNQTLLGQFAEQKGWTVRPDATMFDIIRNTDELSVNTRITLLHRPQNGEKEFFAFVVEGRFTDDDADSLNRRCAAAPHGVPIVARDDLPYGAISEDAPPELEIHSIRHISEPMSVSVSVGETLARMRGDDGPRPE